MDEEYRIVLEDYYKENQIYLDQTLLKVPSFAFAITGFLSLAGRENNCLLNGSCVLFSFAIISMLISYTYLASRIDYCLEEPAMCDYTIKRARQFAKKLRFFSLTTTIIGLLLVVGALIYQ